MHGGLAEGMPSGGHVGLGIPNLRLQGQALRLRWERLTRIDPTWEWATLQDTVDLVTQQNSLQRQSPSQSETDAVSSSGGTGG